MADEKHLAAYRAWLLRQPCCCQPCVAPVVVHHHTAGEPDQHAKSIPGRRGKSQRASDAAGMPLCFRHHANLHELRGFFAGYDKQALRSWQDAQVQRLTLAFAMAHPERIATSSMPPIPAKRKRIGAGWTVATIYDWLRKEAPTRPAAVGAALTELANLIEEDTF